MIKPQDKWGSIKERNGPTQDREWKYQSKPAQTQEKGPIIKLMRKSPKKEGMLESHTKIPGLYSVS